MDTTAYLVRHGWQGTGHSLQPHKTTSLKRPLLVSRKVDVLGVGLSKTNSLSDQWWLRAFDSSLRNLGTGKESVLSSLRTNGAKRGGLYGHFVKGETVEGTIGKREGGGDAESVAETKALETKRKRKADVEGTGRSEKRRKASTATGKEEVSDEGYESSVAKADKEARVKRKAERKAEKRALRLEERAERRVAKKRRSEEKRSKKGSKGNLLLNVEAEAELDKEMEQAGVSSASTKSKYPTKAEKRDKKMRALAAKRGVNIEVIQEEEKCKRSNDALADQQLVLEEHAREVGMSVEAFRALPIKDLSGVKRLLKELSLLDEKKRQRYSNKAAEKGQSLEVYFMRRQVKNGNVKGSSQLKSEPDAPRSQTVKAGGDRLTFVIDTDV
ncbi:hypothetical protein B9Z65_1585 [Elsinoe australis]|uniref:G-patch domain-containing protein n=1 Tax=Elsinoe australis TaxID=40998 RepID=A0A2P7YGA9_9PEZI|nr:hypothetical protein B9Z65_1585 [Elsinoe australis]